MARRCGGFRFVLPAIAQTKFRPDSAVRHTPGSPVAVSQKGDMDCRASSRETPCASPRKSVAADTAVLFRAESCFRNRPRDRFDGALSPHCRNVAKPGIPLHVFGVSAK